MCFGCSNEPSHWDGSFEYPPHMFWMRNKENNFPIHTFIWRPGFNVIDDVIHKLQYHVYLIKIHAGEIGNIYQVKVHEHS